MVVNTSVVYKLASGNVGRIKKFGCLYLLYFRRENVEAASIAGFFLTYHPMHTTEYSARGFNVLSDWLCSLWHGINICIVHPFSKSLRFFLLFGEGNKRKHKR